MLPKIIEHLAPAASLETTRRGFLITAGGAAGALVIGFGASPVRATGAAVKAATQESFDAYLRIAEDGTVTVLSSQFDMGRRYDSRAKTDGTHNFTIDVKLPGMLTAVMIHPPKFGAVVKSVDAAKVKAMPGVVDVVETPRGVAVVGEHMWAALAARDAVVVDWDEANAEIRSSAQIMAGYHKALEQPPQAVARNDGDAAKALAGAAKTVEATFEFPISPMRRWSP